MARCVQVQLIDDITGDEAQETVRFALDGTKYEIDLTSANADKLRSALAKYVENGRKASGRRTGQERPKPAPAGQSSRLDGFGSGRARTVTTPARGAALPGPFSMPTTRPRSSLAHWQGTLCGPALLQYLGGFGSLLRLLPDGDRSMAGVKVGVVLRGDRLDLGRGRCPRARIQG